MGCGAESRNAWHVVDASLMAAFPTTGEKASLWTFGEGTPCFPRALLIPKTERFEAASKRPCGRMVIFLP